MRGHTTPRYKLQLMKLPSSSLQEKHGRYLLLLQLSLSHWAMILIGNELPTEIDLGLPSYDHPWTCWNESIEGP